MPLIHSHILRYLTVWRSLRARWTRCQVGWFSTIYYHCSNWHSRSLRVRCTRGCWFTVIFYHYSVWQCQGAWEQGAKDVKQADSQWYTTTVLFDSQRAWEQGAQDGVDSQSYFTTVLFDSVKELESKVDKMDSAEDCMPGFLQLPFSLHKEKVHLDSCLQFKAFSQSHSPLAFIFFLRTFVMSSSFWRWIVNKL